MSPGVSGVQMRIKSWDPRETAAKRPFADIASCAWSPHNNRSLSLSLTLYVFVCGLMAEYTRQVVHHARSKVLLSFDWTACDPGGSPCDALLRCSQAERGFSDTTSLTSESEKKKV